MNKIKIVSGILLFLFISLIGCSKSDEGNDNTSTTNPTLAPTICFTPQVDPTTNSVYLEKVWSNNDEITIAVNVKGGTDVYGAALWLTYDGNKIKYLSTSPSESYLGNNPTFSSALLNGQEGILLLGIDKRGNVLGSNGDGALTVQSNTDMSFSATNSMLKSPVGNITGTNWLGGSLSYN